MEYTTEQKLIRSECLRKRRETLSLIKEEKLDFIEKYSCVEDCTICNNPIMGKIENCPSKFIILYSKEFNLNCQKTIERIYGEMTQEDWFLVIMSQPPSLKNISYFIRNNLINLDYGSEEFTLLSLYAINTFRFFNWENTFNIILDENGFNINLQNKYGENILLSVLKYDYYDQDDFYAEDRENIQDYNNKIIYLLERGADPLLSNKEGVCSLDYAYSLRTFPQDKKNELISILERYI